MPSPPPPVGRPLSRRPALSALSAACLLAAAAFAVAIGTTDALAQELKIAVFDKQRVVDETKLGLGAKVRFEKLQSEREQQVAERQKAVEGLQQQLTQKAQVLSAERRLDLERDLARARDELQSAAANAERDLQRAYQSAIIDMLTKIDPIIDQFGRSGGYDLLFDISQTAFSRPALDMTNEIIRRVDAAFPQ